VGESPKQAHTSVMKNKPHRKGERLIEVLPEGILFVC